MKRILHVTMTLDTGGVENWLLHVVRAMDRGALRFDFAVASGEGGAYAEELGSLGAGIHFLCAGRNPLLLASRLGGLLRRHGPYDAIHGHLHHVNGIVARCGARAGIPLRISHSHVDTSPIDARGGPLRKAYRRGLRRMIRRHGTSHIAVSGLAARSLFGRAWRKDPRVRILPCGLDFSRFASLPPQEEARRHLGLPPEAAVFGTVGRLEPEKNHGFLLEVLAELLRMRADAHLLLVGKGSREAMLRDRARALGIADRLLFAGARDDIPRVLAAMDVFLFPSLFEGLGLAPIEAQAAGLPCLLSEAVPEEVALFRDRVRILPFDARAWAEAAIASLELPRLPSESSSAEVDAGPFGIAANLRGLYEIYGLPLSGPVRRTA